MRKILVIALALALTACMTPRAQKYMAACVEAGYSEPECKMRAQEINSQAWRGLGAGLEDAGAAMRQAPPAPRITNCNMIGTTIRCTTF